MRHHPPLDSLLLVAVTSALLACTNGDATAIDGVADPRPPVINKALNRTFTYNEGLLRNLGMRGTPIIDGETMDPAILESRKFYDTVTKATRGPTQLPGTAPMSLDDWKRTFAFPPRREDESMETY